MISILLCFSAGLVLSFWTILTLLHNAPEGFEDENGFNVVWRNNTDDAKNVMCIWRVADMAS
jgi:hypothetical protein